MAAEPVAMSAPRKTRTSKTNSADTKPQPDNLPLSSLSTPPVTLAKRKLDETPSSSSKRAKNSEANQPVAVPEPEPEPHVAAPPYSKHPRFWALDGNILLQIGYTRFKVHRSRLASESPWFHKLFDRAPGAVVDEIQAEDTEEDGGDDEDGPADLDDVRIEEAEGLPLYFIDSLEYYKVTVEEFQALLAAMDDAITYYHDPPPFSTVAAILRAADTFQVKRMHKFARCYVEEVFAVDLASFLTLDTKEASMYAAEAVTLGRNWDVNSILKHAFYELAKRPSLGINGKDEEDKEDPIHQLDDIDLIRLAHGQKKLMAAWLRVSSFPALNCPIVGDKACPSKATRLQYWDLVTKPAILQTYQFDPIGGLKKLISSDWKGIGYCSTCIAQQKALLRVEQKDIWKAMGTWFSVE